MFNKNTFITKGINEKLNEFIIAFLWNLVLDTKERKLDYLQIFELENVGTKKEPLLKITWKQEQPEHLEICYLKGMYTDVKRVWVICSGEGTDEEYSTMLLPEEY